MARDGLDDENIGQNGSREDVLETRYPGLTKFMEMLSYYLALKKMAHASREEILDARKRLDAQLEVPQFLIETHRQEAANPIARQLLNPENKDIMKYYSDIQFAWPTLSVEEQISFLNKHIEWVSSYYGIPAPEIHAHEMDEDQQNTMGFARTIDGELESSLHLNPADHVAWRRDFFAAMDLAHHEFAHALEPYYLSKAFEHRKKALNPDAQDTVTHQLSPEDPSLAVAAMLDFNRAGGAIPYASGYLSPKRHGYEVYANQFNERLARAVGGFFAAHMANLIEVYRLTYEPEKSLPAMEVDLKARMDRFTSVISYLEAAVYPEEFIEDLDDRLDDVRKKVAGHLDVARQTDDPFARLKSIQKAHEAIGNLYDDTLEGIKKVEEGDGLVLDVEKAQRYLKRDRRSLRDRALQLLQGQVFLKPEQAHKQWDELCGFGLIQPHPPS